MFLILILWCIDSNLTITKSVRLTLTKMWALSNINLYKLLWRMRSKLENSWLLTLNLSHSLTASIWDWNVGRNSTDLSFDFLLVLGATQFSVEWSLGREVERSSLVKTLSSSCHHNNGKFWLGSFFTHPITPSTILYLSGTASLEG